ncbi:hypothetical protein N431DRAFT_436711 [Stipitochalara longipes BDJ]|nr:hypothetical protein N431DRAFT_436711 [Stipitochalara longipes BDJ]
MFLHLHASRIIIIAALWLYTAAAKHSHCPNGWNGVSSTRFKTQLQALFDAIPRYSLSFFASLGFPSPATATSPAPDIVSMIQSQIGEIAITFPSTLAPACVFRFGVTRRHSVSNPRIPAK